MFEGLRDRRSNRDQEAQDAAIAAATSKLARRRMQQASQPNETAEGADETGAAAPRAAATPRATVAEQLGMVARHTSTVRGPIKPDEDENRETQSMAEADQALTVGSGIHLKGEITNCQTLIVEGHVEGSAKSGVLQIAEHGAFVGEAEIDTAVVSGRFEGTLTAAQRLVIRASGRVSGDIQYAAIAIEAGGQISGNIQVTERPVPENKAISSESAPPPETAAEDYPPPSGPEGRVEIAS